MLLAFALLVIAFATLWPMPGPSHTWAFCLACGDHGTSDLLLNIALFMPLGAALALRGRSAAFIAVVAALLSSAIEVSQLYIPGRDASLGDIVSNTAGAILGALVVQRAHLWLLPNAPVASRLCRAASLAAALICVATGLLLTPSLPASQYYGLWTPNLGHLEWYRGRVLTAALGTMPIAPGPIPAPDRARELLQLPSGYELRVRALAGPSPRSLAPLFAIFDDRRREIVLVGVDREQLVFRVRLRAAFWRFDRPDLRISALHQVRSGDTIAVMVLARDGHYAINGVDRGFTVGSGWALLLYPEALPLKAALSAVWIGALFVPAGFWLRTRMDGAVVALGLLSGLLLVPALTPLLSTPFSQWVAAGLGLPGGAYLARFTAARLARPA